jgi:hypothetical protein
MYSCRASSVLIPIGIVSALVLGLSAAAGGGDGEALKDKHPEYEHRIKKLTATLDALQAEIEKERTKYKAELKALEVSYRAVEENKDIDAKLRKELKKIIEDKYREHKKKSLDAVLAKFNTALEHSGDSSSRDRTDDDKRCEDPRIPIGEPRREGLFSRWRWRR